MAGSVRRAVLTQVDWWWRARFGRGQPGEMTPGVRPRFASHSDEADSCGTSTGPGRSRRLAVRA